jgi:glyoxylase-like metal-dependent hydrolase (beta-lactamase superfamily II)
MPRSPRRLDFNLIFEPSHGVAVAAGPGIMRVTAPNASPFTFHGTNSYVIGETSLAVVDPGPDDDAHLAALVKTIAGRPVSHIFITHTHRDHSPLARRLAELTGAVCLGEGRHRYTNGVEVGAGNALDASADLEFVPDQMLSNGDLIDCGEVQLRAIATPGHTENHMAFALEGSGVLFSGDHVMGWATSIVAPPDGSMERYLDSLSLLAKRKDTVYLPGHGGPVKEPQRHVRALRAHRLLREAAILRRVQKGDTRVLDIVASVYASTDKRLHGAAALTVLAHLERLADHGKIKFDGPLGASAAFRPA